MGNLSTVRQSWSVHKPPKTLSICPRTLFRKSLSPKARKTIEPPFLLSRTKKLSPRNGLRTYEQGGHIVVVQSNSESIVNNMRVFRVYALDRVVGV